MGVFRRKGPWEHEQHFLAKCGPPPLVQLSDPPLLLPAPLHYLHLLLPVHLPSPRRHLPPLRLLLPPLRLLLPPHRLLEEGDRPVKVPGGVLGPVLGRDLGALDPHPVPGEAGVFRTLQVTVEGRGHPALRRTVQAALLQGPRLHGGGRLGLGQGTGVGLPRPPPGSGGARPVLAAPRPRALVTTVPGSQVVAAAALGGGAGGGVALQEPGRDLKERAYLAAVLFYCTVMYTQCT